VADERIRFAGEGAKYDAAFYLQHLLRYALVRGHAQGKRVLDVACGEGYGSHLMAQWGAERVVGVDRSDEAIENARSLFGDGPVAFLQGDVTQLDQVLDDGDSFDLVVSFETIEHLDDPELFLRQILKRLAPGGTIAISCPNDYASLDDEENEFHARKYSFEEFSVLTEEILGKANRWLIGVPALAQLHYGAKANIAEGVHESAREALRFEVMPNSLLMPSQPALRPSDRDCMHYVGIWGKPIEPNAALSPMSYSSFARPWLAVNEVGAARAEASEAAAWRAQAEGELQLVLRSLAYERQIAQRRILHHAEERRRAEQEVASARAQAAAAELARAEVSQALNVAQGEIATLRLELDGVRQEVDRWRRFATGRGYRFIAAYYRLYANPILRRVAGPLRTVTGRTLRRMRQDERAG
jgi:SAM-dependent methyltransferase